VLKTAPQNYVVVALGSNLGDSGTILQGAFAKLAELTDFPLLHSSSWESQPVDCPPGSPAFINEVVAFIPRLPETPESILKRLQALEKDFGRKPKTVMNEPRPLDLDLIAFQTEVRRDPRLTVPHPRACERGFVLGPLAEILPGLVLPGQTVPVSELFARLPADARTGLRKL